MKATSTKAVEEYLSRIHRGERIKIEYFGSLSDYNEGKARKSGGIKSLGYGVPQLVRYTVGTSESKPRESIISTLRIGYGFGHDYRADRVDNLTLAFDTWNSLPRHCKVEDLGAFIRGRSSLVSLGEAEEFFLLRPLVRGIEYYKDLDRIFSEDELQTTDVERARVLGRYLATIHSKKRRPDKKGSRELYARKIRDTIGHGECIFGLADSYPENVGGYLRAGELESIEKKCVEHRWKLRNRVDRLSQVHGDYHPWNIIFHEEGSTKFTVLDRSRGEWGEPADDVCAMSINYIFYSLRKHGGFQGVFATLYDEFLRSYLQESTDKGIFDAMPLFYTFRALVIASPLWYPTLAADIRRKIFNFAENVLESPPFDSSKINDYILSPR